MVDTMGWILAVLITPANVQDRDGAKRLLEQVCDLFPRLIAAFGSDRSRYSSAAEVQCYSGIAPVTRRSGKTLHVSSRYACPKFLKQTFHEFADHARKWSRWSAAYYRQKREAGCKHQAAVRALAFKWIRIMFRLWKTHSTYDETRYIQQLKQTNSPLVKYLETA